MTDKTDQLSRRRYILVSLLAMTYLIGQLASLTFMEPLTGLSETTLQRIDDICLALLVMVLLVAAWTYVKAQTQDAAALSALNDELSKHHARMAAVFCFKFVFILSFFLFVIARTATLEAEDVAKIVFTSCLVVSYLRFAWLELKHA